MKDLFGDEIAEKTKRGGGESMFRVNGCSNHSLSNRADYDFYATPPAAVHMLCDLESFKGPILEPSCGLGHISKALKEHGYDVESRDLVNRGYGKGGCDFLADDDTEWGGDIVMNPPYDLAREFVEKALAIIHEGRKIAAFLKLTFAEGTSRRCLFTDTPPIRVWVSSKRLECGKNGVFTGASAVAYAWWIWEKGFHGQTTLKWFN